MSQINVKKQLDSATFLPEMGYVALFYSEDLGAWAYKDEAGTVFPFASEAFSSRSLFFVGKNNTGASIPIRTPVYINGASGNKPTIAVSTNASEAGSTKTIGFTSGVIPNGGEGNIVISGFLANVDTSGFTEEDKVWLGVNGAITSTRPVVPAHAVFLGYITRVNATQGSIEVVIQNGFEVDELHDVLLTSLVDGQVLYYENSSGLWKNKSLSAADISGLGALATLNTVNTTEIDDGAVTNAKIGTNAITAVKINNNSVLNSKASDMPAQTIKGNDTGATNDPKDLTVSETKILLALDQVNNTSDANKPVSAAQATAIGAAITAHEAAADPHPQYLTPAEGNSAYQPLDGDLTAVAALAGAGFAVRTTTNTWATRSLTTPGGSGIGITNQDGVFGSPAFTNTDKGSTAVATHEAAADPHPQYETSAEAQAKVDAHANLTNNPHAVTKAQVGLGNVPDVDATLRSNHTGSQLAATISNFEATVRATVLTGLSLATNAVISASDTVLSALGKLQAQLTQAISDVNATFLLKANLSGGNTFSGDQVVNGGLRVNSTTQGFLLPRMTTAQMNAIATPAQGLKIYNTGLNTVCTYDGAAWLFEIYEFVTSNQASTSITYANIAELVTPALPVGRYIFEFFGACQSTAITTGVGIRLAANGATIGAINATWSFSQAANGTDKDFNYSQLAPTTDVASTGVLTANADFPVLGSGIFSLSVAGSVAAQIRTEIAASGVSIRINSVLKIKRISG